MDVETAKKLNEIFLEIVVAYDFTEEALDVLRQKKNLRVLKLAKIGIWSKYGSFKIFIFVIF